MKQVVVILAGLLTVVLMGCGGSIESRQAAMDDDIASLMPESAEAMPAPAQPPRGVDGGVAPRDSGRAGTDTLPSIVPTPPSGPVLGVDGKPLDKAEPCAPPPRSDNVVSVRDHGARGDGITDDTAAIQRAIDAVAGTGGTVMVPDGIYIIDAVHVSSSYGLRLKSDMTFRMTAAAVLQVKPNSAGGYRAILIRQAKNVAMVGGTLIGDRDQHLGTRGEWGMGIGIQASENVVIDNVTVKKAWGDGFYVHAENGVRTRQLTICRVVADGNRRQGLSFIDVDGAVVRDSAFINTQGAPPAAGIDFEPNNGNTNENVRVFRSVFRGNQGDGIQSGVPGRETGFAFIRNIVMENNLISDNLKHGIEISNSGPQVVRNNLIERNTRDGVYIRGGAHDITVTGNTVRDNTGRGIVDAGLRGSNTITNNILSGNLNRVFR